MDENTKIQVVARQKNATTKKLLGMPIIALLIIGLVAVSGLAVLSYYLISNTNITLGTPVTAHTNAPTTLNIVAGDYKEYTWNATNNANTAMNIKVMSMISQSDLENNEVKVTIYDSGHTELASSSTLVGNSTTATTGDINVPASGSVNGFISVQFSNSADAGTYTYTNEVLPGTNVFQ